MNKLICVLLTGLAISHYTFAEAVPSETDSPLSKSERIEKCTELLPEGHSYKIDIHVSLDKKSPKGQRVMTKELSVSDDTEKVIKHEREKEIQPFIQCMADNVF